MTSRSVSRFVSVAFKILIVSAVIAACTRVPVTGRRQFMLVSEEQEMQLGEQAYQEVLGKEKLSDHAEWSRMVDDVGRRIAAASNQPDFKWQFRLLEGEEANAFCLPGGKVAFWEGIMPICETESGVAVVMGHEVAHAIAHHGAERMSQGLGANIVGEVLAAGLGGSDPAVRQNVMQLYGLGATVGVILPFSRKHESEADHIGLVLMAKAGFDPRASIPFWQRMEKAAGERGGGAPPEFLSTHPSGDTRIRQLQEWMPEALEHYEKHAVSAH